MKDVDERAQSGDVDERAQSGDVYLEDGDWDLLFCSLVGSQAHGLASEDSDHDYVGVFRASTEAVLGLDGPRLLTKSVVRTKPDYTYHEVAKYLKLALGGNPTVLETMWLPRSHYVALSEDGKEILFAREAFLSNRVRKSYGGFVTQVIKKKTKKSIRHAFRLIRQGRHLLETGELVVAVDDPEGLLAFAERPWEDIESQYLEELVGFNECKSVLPDEPDTKRVNDLLVQLRLDPLDLSSQTLRTERDYAKQLLRTVYRMRSSSAFDFGSAAIESYLKDGDGGEHAAE